MKDKMKFEIGDNVTIIHSKVDGVVTGYYITGNSLKYEVSFFLNGEHQAGFFDDFLLTKQKPKRAGLA